MSDNAERVQFPIGFRFAPDEEELVGDYLYKKKMGTLTLFEKGLVTECDLYGEKEPWEIWEMSSRRNMSEFEDLFFFTKLKKKFSNGNASHINRLVGVSGGKWHGVDSEATIKAPIEGHQNSIEGSRRRFSYKNPNSDQNGRWIMHEYTLKQSNDDVALCRLRKKHSKSEAEILVNGSAEKNKRNPEFEETLHKKRKLNQNETLTANEELVENIQGNQNMGLAYFNDEGATIAAIVLADGNSSAESNSQEKIGAATVDDGIVWEGLEGTEFSFEELLGPM